MAKHVRRHLAVIRHLLKRLYFARKRKKALALLVLCIIVSAVFEAYAALRIYPNTYLGSINVSGQSAASVNALLDTLASTPHVVRVQDRAYSYSYRDLGIVIDHEKILAELFAPNLRGYPANIVPFIRSAFKNRRVAIPLAFTQDFHQFIHQTVFDFGDSSDEVLFDDKAKSLTYIENEEKYRIDGSSFETLLASRVDNTDLPLYPKLAKLTNEKANMVLSIADRIKSIYLSPMTVYVDLGGTIKSFALTERELADIAHVTLSADQTDASVSLNSTTAMYLINEHIKKANILARGNVATQKVLRDLEDALSTRFDGQASDAITIAYDKGPNTDGSIAQKYIEVDISQQKMYLFKSNRLTKSYRVSTGLEYPTPTGEFTILNKAGLGYSNIYDVWMPWWMGFKYSDELHAYFGIHELPYKLTGNNVIRRPANFIGSPNTGGCVALGVGDAKEVYQFADIGTKIVIYQ